MATIYDDLPKNLWNRDDFMTVLIHKDVHRELREMLEDMLESERRWLDDCDDDCCCETEEEFKDTFFCQLAKLLNRIFGTDHPTTLESYRRKNTSDA